MPKKSTLQEVSMHDKLFNRLHQEHEEVKQIMIKMMNSGTEKRGGLVNELKTALLPHMEGEEKVFYTEIMDKNETHQITLEAFLEHRVARNLFNELENSRVDADDWLARTKVLKDILEHHIEEEESEMFEATEKIISHEKMDQIFNNYLQEEKGFKDRLAA